MLYAQSLPWSDPLDLAAGITDAWWVLLYSGVRTSYSGRYSYLAHDMAEHIEGDDFSGFAEKLTADGEPFGNAWFGYLGYELKDCLKTLAPSVAGWLPLPRLFMMRFNILYQFDHEERRLTRWSQSPVAATPVAPPPKLLYPTTVLSLSSNMSDADYLRKATEVIDRIHNGDLYQANLTRKFMGQFAEKPDYFGLFQAFCRISPAPYSAFMRLGNRAILSSSPELFLHADANGHIRTRPIKGTAPRFSDAQADAASRKSLAQSAKDRAENLMITDLMRNDLSRSCVPGSVATESLFDVTTHATIHHMSSTVTGQKRTDCSTLDMVRHCFPPGSMTGAPKIEAMKLCGQLELLERGVYSGALGWFGGNGTCELSVVIRTLIIQDNRFEFQVGGGIVADSTPERELQELIDKAKGILKTLGLTERDLHL